MLALLEVQNTQLGAFPGRPRRSPASPSRRILCVSETGGGRSEVGLMCGCGEGGAAEQEEGLCRTATANTNAGDTRRPQATPVSNMLTL